MHFVDLQEQYRRIKPQADSAIQSVLERASFIQGESVSALESDLASYSGAQHCITCGNGTDAIQIALMALGIGPGDAVFTTNFSFIGTAEPVALLGAVPIFCDVTPQTFNLCANSLEENIRNTQSNSKLTPKAIIAVDIFGAPCDYAKLQRLANKYDIPLIADAAQSYGAHYNNKNVGAICDISTTSFFPAKPLGCYGDGGAIFCQDQELAKRMRSIAAHGKGKHKYDHTRIGINSRLDSIQAALLRVKLTILPREIERRNLIANELQAACSARNLQYQMVLPNTKSAYAQFSLLTPKGKSRETTLTRLNEAGIPTQVYYPTPLSKFDIWPKSVHIPTPVTYNLCETIFSIPVHPYLKDEDIKAITETLLTL